MSVQESMVGDVRRIRLFVGIDLMPDHEGLVHITLVE